MQTIQLKDKDIFKVLINSGVKPEELVKYCREIFKGLPAELRTRLLLDLMKEEGLMV